MQMIFLKKKIQEQVQILNNHKNVGLTSTWTKIQDLNGNQVKKFESIKKNSEIKKKFNFCKFITSFIYYV